MLGGGFYVLVERGVISSLAPEFVDCFCEDGAGY